MIASGVLTTSYEGRSVTYRSMADLLRARSDVDDQIASANDTPRIRQRRIVHGKGLE